MNLATLETHVPGFSLQDLSHTNILSMPMGKVVPVLIDFFHPGESIEVDFDWLCRTMPLNAPLMDTMEICFDAFWVPARVLGISDGDAAGFNYEQFFNPKNIQSETELPNYPINGIFEDVLENEGKLQGTLYDYLGYPTFPECFRRIEASMAGSSFKVDLNAPEQGEVIPYYIPFAEFDNAVVQDFLEGANLNLHHLVWYYKNYPATDDEDWNLGSTLAPVFNIVTTDEDNNSKMWFAYCSFTMWVLRLFTRATGNPANYNGSLAAFNTISKELNDPFGYICSYLKVSPSQLFDSWKCWLYSNQAYFEKYVSRPDPYKFIRWFVERTVQGDDVYGWYALLGADVGESEKYVSLVPFVLYGRIISDWYINPLLADGDAVFKNIFKDLNSGDLGFDDLDYKYLSLANRLYGFDDAFVSATATADQPNVLLPANPSVKDIRNASALQLMLERIAKTGKRYMDQILTTFGIQPNNQRLDRSEVLFRRTAILDMQSVTQMNQSDFGKLLNSPIGSQFGQSVSFQTFQGNTITFDEHGFYVIMASIRPKASYFQGLNKFLTCLRADQFLVPDFAQIGDDKIDTDEIYFDFGRTGSSDFAYQQRYYNWMWHPSEIHGLMQNELDYYHLGRRFTSKPVFNETFTSVNVDQNDLNRVFTVYDSTPFLMWINFKEKALRPLPTSSNYSL